MPGLIGKEVFLTSDHDDEALFMKAYSLKQTTVQCGAHPKPDEEMAVGDTTTVSGRTDLFDEILEVQAHKQSLQLARGQVHAGFDVIELTVLKGPMNQSKCCPGVLQ